MIPLLFGTERRAIKPSNRKTRRSFFVVAAVVLLLATVFWRPIQQHCLVYLLLRSEAPSEQVLSEAVEHATAPQSVLNQFWRTQRIPHRQFVIRYLERISDAKAALLLAMEPLIREAVVDPDITVRESAFATLAKAKDTQLRTPAQEQLSDADPAVRLLGLQALRAAATSNDVSIAMRLLNDPEPRVVVAAAQVLRRVTGQDFGIRSAHALPQFSCIGTNPPPPPDLEAIRQGVKRWEQWWSHHQSEFPSPSPAPPVYSHPVRLATTDFTLRDSGGHTVKLAQFRGKAVLLSFWSPGVPASLDDTPALIRLQQQNPSTLAVIGVCVPAAPSCADEHATGHSHTQHHSEHLSGGSGSQHLPCSVADAAKRLHVPYPMLVDNENSLGLRFQVEDLPAYLLIDAEGMVRRRFVGFRTESALAAMVKEVADAQPCEAAEAEGKRTRAPGKAESEAGSTG